MDAVRGVSDRLSRRRGGENFKNFQAAAAARVVSLPATLEFFLSFACFFLKKFSIKVFFRNQTLH
jgi:hypothetical protein